MTIDGAGTVVDLDADVARAPASTQKIYVAAAILAALGRDHRYVTEVRSSAIVNDGVVETLFLRASGDPSLSSTQLESLAAAVAASGVREVPGGLAIDDSRFDAARRVDVWKPSFTPGEVGVLNAFSVDGNHRNETDAGLANLSRFRSALRKRGVVVGAGDRRASIGNGGPVLASVQSAPLAELVRTMVKRSDNTYAELFTKELGARRGVGSTASGVAAIASYMVSLGVAAPVVQIDGSGLSLQNRSTARQQVAFFRKASDTLGGSFLEAMPVACVDGTLKNRMCATAAAKRARAKSGAIDFVVGLTGTTETANGKRVTFSFLLNSVKSSASARAAIDRAVAAASAATI